MSRSDFLLIYILSKLREKWIKISTKRMISATEKKKIRKLREKEMKENRIHKKYLRKAKTKKSERNRVTKNGSKFEWQR